MALPGLMNGAYEMASRVSVAGLYHNFVSLFWHYGQVCYDGIGCFANDHRIDCPSLGTWPESPDTIHCSFHLYSPEYEHGDVAQSLDYFNMSSFAEIEHVMNRPLYVVVHGFSKVYPFDKFLKPMKNALISAGNNVLLVDWISAVHWPNYLLAASNGRVVGAMIANVALYLARHHKSQLNTTTIVGYSLGAHVAGFAGKHLLPNFKVGSIVGLDPCNDLFTDAPRECRLAETDAEFVQVVHTNGKGPKSSDAYALPEPMGHADFYFNGGEVQKACHDSKCSHDLSYIYYIESVRRAATNGTCRFTAYPCKTEVEWDAGHCFSCATNTSNECPVAGYNATKDARGTFYIATMAENRTTGDYCGDQYLMEIVSDVDVKGSISLVISNSNVGGTLEEIEFQRKDELLNAGVPKRRIIVLPQHAKNRNMSMVYNQYESWVWSDGPEEWTVRHFALKDHHGELTMTKHKITGSKVKDDVPVLLY